MPPRKRGGVVRGLLTGWVVATALAAAEDPQQIPLPPRAGVALLRYTQRLVTALPPRGSRETQRIRQGLQEFVSGLQRIPPAARQERLRESVAEIEKWIPQLAAFTIDTSALGGCEQPVATLTVPADIPRTLLVGVWNPQKTFVRLRLEESSGDRYEHGGFSGEFLPESTTGMVVRLTAAAGRHPIPLQLKIDDEPHPLTLVVHSVPTATLTIDVDGPPARLRVTGPDGWTWRPGDLVHYPAGTSLHPPDPPADADARAIALDGDTFYIAGPGRVTVPAGNVRVLASRGPFHDCAETTRSMTPGGHDQLTVNPQRWISPPEHSSISGDVHVHVRRTAAWDPLLARILQAEDLDVMECLVLSNRMQDWALQDSFGPESRFRTGGRRYLSSGQEFRNGLWGHVDLLGHTKMLRPLSTGPALTSDGQTEPDYPANATMIRRARERNGIPVIAHGGNLGHEGVVDLILGESRVLEVLQFGDYSGLDLWYDLLSAGFHVAPAGGTDFPVGGLPGTERVVVRSDGTDYPDWLQALEDGRSFVTNGPWLELSINDHEAGETLVIQSGEPLKIQARLVTAAPSQPASDLQLVIGGRVYSGETSSQGRTHTLTTVVPADVSTWIAARTIPSEENARRLAHTAAVRICVDGKPPADSAAAGRLAQRVEQVIRIAESRAMFQTPDQRSEVLDLFQSALRKLRDVPAE